MRTPGRDDRQEGGPTGGTAGACIACASARVRPVDAWPDAGTLRPAACADCGLLFLADPPVAGTHESPARVVDWPPLGDGSRPAPTKKGAALALMAAFDRHFAASRPSAGARMFATGAGAASWLNAFRDRGWETFGIGDRADASGGPHQLVHDLAAGPGFDLVVAYHVLERQAHPLDALVSIARALRPGGYCFLSVPRLDTLAEHGDFQYCLRPGRHLSAFTEACLAGLLARAGLEVVDTLHGLDRVFTGGVPLRLRVLARRTDAPPPDPAPATALDRVLAALPAAAAQPRPAPDPAAPSHCPACDGGDVQVIDAWRLPGGGSRAAVCGRCGLLFVHPQPTTQALASYYAEEGGWHASRLDRITPSGPARIEGAAAILLPVLDAFFPATAPVAGARVFDFGCGDGGWLDMLQGRGWTTFGLEPSTDAAFVRHARLTSVPDTPQFQFVLAYHVLEHLPRPLDTLRALAGALLPGGYCLVSVPRLDTLATHGQIDYCLHPRHHIVGFTEACLRGLLARAGLTVVRSFHDLQSAWSKGRPVRLQLLAHKGAPPAVPDVVPAEEAERVVDALKAIRTRGGHAGS